MKAVELFAVRFFLSMQTLTEHQQPLQRLIRLWNLATQITQDSPQPRFELLQLFLHALKLFRVRITTDHDGCLLRNTQVVLTQPEASIPGRTGQLHQSCVIQFGIGWMRDVLLLHGRINIDLSQFLWRHLLFLHSDGDGLLQHLSQLIGADTLSPFRE